MTGVWACIVTVGASLAISYWKESHAALAPKQEYAEGLTYQKTGVINVPMIAEGSVQGYVVAQEHVNKRLQADVLQDVLVQDFNYVSKDQIRR